MKRVEKVAVHVVGPGDQKKLTEEREHGGILVIHGGLPSTLPHLPKHFTLFQRWTRRDNITNQHISTRTL